MRLPWVNGYAWLVIAGIAFLAGTGAPVAAVCLSLLLIACLGFSYYAGKSVDGALMGKVGDQLDPLANLHRLAFELLDAAELLPPGPVRTEVMHLAMDLFGQFEQLAQK